MSADKQPSAPDTDGLDYLRNRARRLVEAADPAYPAGHPDTFDPDPVDEAAREPVLPGGPHEGRSPLERHLEGFEHDPQSHLTPAEQLLAPQEGTTS